MAQDSTNAPTPAPAAPAPAAPKPAVAAAPAPKPAPVLKGSNIVRLQVKEGKVISEGGAVMREGTVFLATLDRAKQLADVATIIPDAPVADNRMVGTDQGVKRDA